MRALQNDFKTKNDDGNTIYVLKQMQVEQNNCLDIKLCVAALKAIVAKYYIKPSGISAHLNRRA